MKFIKVKIFFITTLLFSCQFQAMAKEIIFRPVTITVFDEETKMPLEGVLINVINVTFYQKYKTNVILDPEYILTHQLYVYETNEMGI